MANNHQIAEALYIGEASDETYHKVFSKVELIELWTGHCVYQTGPNGELIEPTASYDDKVYNALDRHGYWDNK